MSAARETGPLRFLALGDSYTIGEGVPAGARWPARLVHRLAREGIALEEPEIVAATGWTTDELDAEIDATAPRGPYALVTLLIGVNDQYRGRPATDYRPAFAGLLQRAIEFAGNDARHVLVVSIPDWGVTRFAREQGRDRSQIGHELDLFNATAREETVRRNAHWVDITPLSRRCGAAPDMLAADGLHPSPQQYDGWVEHILPIARHALRK